MMYLTLQTPNTPHSKEPKSKGKLDSSCARAAARECRGHARAGCRNWLEGRSCARLSARPCRSALAVGIIEIRGEKKWIDKCSSRGMETPLL